MVCTCSAAAVKAEAAAGVSVASLSFCIERAAEEDRAQRVLATVRNRLLELEDVLREDGAITGVLVRTWLSFSEQWRAAVARARTLAQLGVLVSALRERAVDWDIFYVEPSSLDRKTWQRMQVPQPGELTRSYIPEAGESIVYFGLGHQQAVTTVTKVLKREAAAIKKSVDSRRRRERERKEREREREKERERLQKQAGLEGGDVDGVAAAGAGDDGAGGGGSAAKTPASAKKKKKRPPPKAAAAMAPLEDADGAVGDAGLDIGDDDDDDDEAEEDGEQLRRTALEMLAHSKPREGVCKCEVADVTYHYDRVEEPYCRVKLRVAQWFAGAQGDAVLTHKQHGSDHKPGTVLRMPSLCVVKDGCFVCGDGGEVMKVSCCAMGVGCTAHLE